MKPILRFFASVVFVFLIVLPFAFAQSQATTGLIQGNVADPSGAVVQGATVTVINIDTGFERTVTSNSDGFFSAPLLPLGKYRVTTTAANFTKSVLEGIELNIGQTLSLKIDLKIGGAVETVNVTAEGVGVETSRTELNTLINERSVENLPISRRDFSKFVQLTPGVSIVQGPDGDEITITVRKGFKTTFRLTGRTPTTRFSANSAAVSARRSPSVWNLSRNSKSSRSARPPSSGAVRAVLSTP